LGTHGNPFIYIVEIMATVALVTHGNPWKPKTSGNPWKPMETTFMETYRNLWKPMDTFMETHGKCCIGNPWKPMDTEPMGFHEFPQLMEIHGNLWTLLWKPMAIVASGTRGNPWTPYKWVSMDCGNLWKPIDTCMETRGNLCIDGILWKPTDIYGNH
jgi:hypothetical protein